MVSIDLMGQTLAFFMEVCEVNMHCGIVDFLITKSKNSFVIVCFFSFDLICDIFSLVGRYYAFCSLI